jgi:hypothetical protein
MLYLYPVKPLKTTTKMKTISKNYRGKLITLIAVTLFSLPAFAQRHASNDFFMDTNHRDNKALVRDITFGFLSPINKHISFAYEQAMNYQSVLCVRVGIISSSIGIQDLGGMYAQSEAPSAGGGYLSVGAKLFVHPDFVMQGMYRYNDMQGFYFNPEVIVGNFNYTYTWYSYSGYPTYRSITTTSTDNVTSYAVILNLGKQWVIGNRFVVNVHAGIGYGGASVSGPQPAYGQGNVLEMIGGNYYDYLASSSIAFSGGLDLGVLF